MSAVVIDGAVVHYEVWGRGRPLILLHGWLGSWRYWMQTMESLASGCRTYAIDLWGFGDSAKHKARYNMVSYVRLLNDFMNAMGIEQASCIGHALGGAVALIFASRRPERVEKLVTVSTPLQATAISPRLRSFSNTIASQVVLKQDNAWIKRLLSLAKADQSEITNEAAKADPDALSESMRSLAVVDLLKEFNRVKSQQLSVLGHQDPLINAELTTKLNDNRYNARAIVLSNSRHFPMLEEPPQFHRLMRDLLIDDIPLAKLEVKSMWHRRHR